MYLEIFKILIFLTNFVCSTWNIRLFYKNVFKIPLWCFSLIHRDKPQQFWPSDIINTVSNAQIFVCLAPVLSFSYIQCIYMYQNMFVTSPCTSRDNDVRDVHSKLKWWLRHLVRHVTMTSGMYTVNWNDYYVALYVTWQWRLGCTQ